ncbi:hypothetical protein JCGZ_02954 [Jatropha curcas]|uniref:Transmembrane protein n=1 Tax=Jatropha curcas TaxID=180498 RepID=A0A067LDV1_JATCU|nr:uncharacterized protein LOC105629932 [Jatropha curcas]XP_020533367.1 uncharacterized protein LOC105629932 [Jatropha curcas]KDP42224.1 hypothetical protein JCGZ_02954 [Jatropha curcas]
MQRQSLGSPVSKLNSHGGAPKEDTLMSDTLSLPAYDDDGGHRKATKPRRFSMSSSSPSSSPSKPEKLVHFIPILTFLCFLVLYLVSHSPSQSDLSQFNGFKQSLKHIDSVTDVSGFSELRRGDVLARQSLRNLREIADKRASAKSRAHRKIADF